MTTIARTADAFAAVDPSATVSVVARRRRVARWVMTGALLIGIFTLDVRLFAPYAAGAAAALRHPAPGWVALAIGAELASMAAAGHLQRRMLQAGGTRVTTPTMISITYAANALSMSLPAGFALSAGYMFRRLRQLGASVPIVGFTMLSSGVLSTIAFGVLALLGVALAGGAAGSSFAFVGALLTAGAFIVASRSVLRHLELLDCAVVRVLPTANRLLRRRPDRGLKSAIESTKVLREIDPRGRDWAAGLTFALVNWVGDLACLVASCQAVGAHRATLSVVLLAYLAGMSVSSVSLVPGGLGVVDAAFIVMLVRGGVSAPAAASGVVLYRALSFGFVVLAGWGAWAAHWLGTRRSADGPTVVPTTSL